MARVSRSKNEEETAVCPVEGCDKEALKRGMFMHIFQTDDPEGERHHPRYEMPPGINVADVKVSGSEEVEMNYPTEQEIGDVYYLDTYTGKAYKGKRGLMVHLGQKAGSDNIPEDVTERHDAEDFPIVDIDEDGNVTEVIRPPTDTVPAIEPYLPWYEDDDLGYIEKQRIKEFIKEVEESPTGAASPDAIREALLE